MKKPIKYTLVILNICMPVIFVIISLAVLHKGIGDVIPVWGDENWWWQQANAVGRYGHPLGYWGYNGGTAAVGTFATWGAAAVMPYGLFSTLGWTYHTFVYANLFYQAVAIGLFILLTKPSEKGLLVLIVVNMSQIVRNMYLFVCMQESIRSAMGLIAAGLLIWLFRNREKANVLNCIGIGVYIFAIGQAYLIWTVFFLPLMLIVNYNRKPNSRIFLSVFEAGLLVMFSRVILRLFSSPYLSSSNTPFSDRLKNNIRDYVDIARSGEISAFFKCFHFGLIIVGCLILVFLVVKRKIIDKESRVLILSSGFLLVVFLFGHIVLYNTTTWTFTRGMEMGIFVSAFILSVTENKLPAMLMALWGVSCMALLYLNHIDDTFLNERRFISEEWRSDIESTQALMVDMNEALEEYGAISDDPWDYTVATYNASPNPVSLSLPKGYSVNTNPDGVIRTNARWIAVGKVADIEKAEEYIEAFLAEGYVVSKESEKLAILMR